MTINPHGHKWEELFPEGNQGALSKRRDSGREKQLMVTAAGKLQRILFYLIDLNLH